MNAAPQDHARAADKFVADLPRAQWHDKALWFVRSKRDKSAASLPEWEELRQTASAIKAHTVANLAALLEEFESNAIRLGATVHWAESAEDHNRIVTEILQSHGVKKIVKSKSMLTEECHLNPHLEAHGIEVIDTDLGERIVQLRHEPPSHIVLPAIHLKKEDVGEVFHEHMGTQKGASDPGYLTESARIDMRQRFWAAEAGITGVNFAIAKTGGFVVCTNEGNADLGVAMPRLHIACMGIEKLIPRSEDLGVFTRLLARSATGQPITTYTSHFHGPQNGGELHIVLVDNGRSELRQSDDFREALNCIRCGACMNTCPVYRRSGGHSYGSTIPGPIGSILSPAQNTAQHKTLPFACSLCGSCTDVCPVKIPLHHQLLTWRRHIALKKLLPLSKRLSMKAASFVLSRPALFRLAGKIGRLALRVLPKFLINGPWNKWGKQRDLPPAPAQSFSQLYQIRKTSSGTPPKAAR